MESPGEVAYRRCRSEIVPEQNPCVQTLLKLETQWSYSGPIPGLWDPTVTIVFTRNPGDCERQHSKIKDVQQPWRNCCQRWVPSSKSCCFFFFWARGSFCLSKGGAPACLLVRSKKFPMTVAHCRVQKINFWVQASPNSLRLEGPGQTLRRQGWLRAFAESLLMQYCCRRSPVQEPWWVQRFNHVLNCPLLFRRYVAVPLRCRGETFYPRPTLTIGARRFKSGSNSGLLPLLPADVSRPRVGPPPDLNLPGAWDELQPAVNWLRVIKVA